MRPALSDGYDNAIRPTPLDRQVIIMLESSEAFAPIRAVMPVVPPEILAWRRESGADQWDEMWEEVLHMAPAPNLELQDLEGELATWLRMHWAWPGGGKVTQQANLAASPNWRRNYRIPDIVLLSPQRLSARKAEYIEGPPDVVIEIHSPGDESRAKLAFYAALGVPEAWIIDRDTKHAEILLLAATGYMPQSPGADNWTRSPATGVELRVMSGKLIVRLNGTAATEVALPRS